MTRPLLLLVTYISLLSLLFSVLLYKYFWVFLAVESCFDINLGVLSSVLCGQRSLDVTVRGGPKPRGRRLNSKTLDHH